MTLRALGAAAAILLAVLAGRVLADTWLPPAVKQYHSAEGDVRLTVVPRGLSSPLAYFEDLVEGRENAGQAENGETLARGVLERRAGPDVWEKVWAGPLVNDVSPVSAMVASNGRYAVTFDNWHSIGRGQHVIVMYDRQGRLIRSLELSDIIPPEWIRGLSHSVSSTYWAGEHRFSGEDLILEVLLPSMEGLSGERAFIDISLDLETGAVSPVDQNAWTSALGEVEAVNRAMDVAEAERDRRFREPLRVPAEPTERTMHGFLVEAFFRISPDWDDGYPATKVLRHPDADNYAASEGWVREAFADSYSGRTIMIAGLSEPALVALLIRIGPDLSPKSLTDVTVYLAVSAEAWPAVRRALAHTGATLVHLDTALAIPQRPERLSRYNEAAGSMMPPALN
jgi:hypothetical protein